MEIHNASRMRSRNYKYYEQTQKRLEKYSVVSVNNKSPLQLRSGQVTSFTIMSESKEEKQKNRYLTNLKHM